MNQKPSWAREDSNGVKYVVWGEVYQAYKNDCLARGEKPESHTKFTRRHAQFFPDFKRRFIVKKVDGKATRVLLNVGFKSEESL